MTRVKRTPSKLKSGVKPGSRRAKRQKMSGGSVVKLGGKGASVRSGRAGGIKKKASTQPRPPLTPYLNQSTTPKRKPSKRSPKRSPRR